MQLATESPHSTPASVLTHEDSSSLASPSQQDEGEHTVHEHILVCVML